MKPTNKTSKPGTRPAGFSTGAGQSTGSPQGFVQPKSAKPPSNTALPASTTVASATPAHRSAPPMKKRAKGSGFLGLIFVAAFFALGYAAWTSLLQYQAFGRIEGRVISVGAPWDGSLTSWEVRDGEIVNQGQVLAQIKNLDMDHQLATFGDELKMNQALLEAEMSKISFESHTLGQQNQKVVAEYHQTFAELQSEEETFKELTAKYERSRRLFKSNNLSRSAYETTFFKFAGQKKKIEQLSNAVEVLRMRSQSVVNKPNGATRLKPLLSEIELTKFKMERLREKIEQGKIRSPVTGRVSKRHLLTGESARSTQVVIDILEDNSIEAVLYLPQRVIAEYEVGKTVDVSIEPYSNSLPCRVERFGDRFQTAPSTIARYYQKDQPLLPVYLKPLHDTSSMLAARVGGTIKRPYDYSKSLSRLLDNGKNFLKRFTGQPQSNSKPVQPIVTLDQTENNNDVSGHPVIANQIDSQPAPLASSEIQTELLIDSLDSNSNTELDQLLLSGQQLNSQSQTVDSGDLIESSNNLENTETHSPSLSTLEPIENLESATEPALPSTDLELLESGSTYTIPSEDLAIEKDSIFRQASETEDLTNQSQDWKNTTLKIELESEETIAGPESQNVIPPFPKSLLRSNSSTD